MTDVERIDNLYRFINYTAKSGLVNIRPIIRELAFLTGLNPNEVMKETKKTRRK